MSSICSIAAEAHAMKETGLKKFGQTCLEGSTYIVNIYFETIKLSLFFIVLCRNKCVQNQAPLSGLAETNFFLAQFLPGNSRRFATSSQKSANDHKSLVDATGFALTSFSSDVGGNGSRGSDRKSSIQNITSEVERLLMHDAERNKLGTVPSGTSATIAELVSTSSAHSGDTTQAVGFEAIFSSHEQGGGSDGGRRQTDVELEGQAQIVFGIAKNPVAEASVGNDAWLATTYHSLLAVLQVISKYIMRSMCT